MRVVATVLGSGPECAKNQRRVTYTSSCPLNKFYIAPYCDSSLTVCIIIDSLTIFAVSSTSFAMRGITDYLNLKLDSYKY